MQTGRQHMLGEAGARIACSNPTEVRMKENPRGFLTIFKMPPKLALATPRFQGALTLNWM